MKKRIRKALSLLLAAILTFGVCAVGGGTMKTNAVNSSDLTLRYPVSGYSAKSVSGSHYSSSHTGTDFAGNTNCDALAAADGVVKQTYTYTGNLSSSTGGQADGGTRIAIYHASLGIYTVYKHLDAIYVSEGQTVKAGDAIGSLGNTGYSFGVHLHFDICTSIHNYAYPDSGTTLNPEQCNYYYTSTPPITITPGTSITKTKVSWQAVSGATQYDLAIYVNNNGNEGTRQTLIGGLSASTTSYSLQLPAGSWIAVLAASTSGGAQWIKSAPFTVKQATGTLTVNYYSNYADKSFDSPKNAIGASKNVIVRTAMFGANDAIPDGLHNYLKKSSGTYLGRTGFTGTGNWNTKPDGTGISVNQDTVFSSGAALAKALGVDLTTGNKTIKLYPEWTENKLTVNYYSNKADQSFSNPKNAVGADKNVIVKVLTYKYSQEYTDGLTNYTKASNNAYLARTGFTGTGNWNTKANGSGISIGQTQSFATGQEMAQAFGKDLSNGNATVNIYPEWTRNKLTIYYCSNYADQSFENPKYAVGANKSMLVRTTYAYYGYKYSDGLRNYTDPSDDTYLGRTGYTATGNWNTAKDGSGYRVNQDTAFASGQALAQALGKDITTGNASIYIYPEWTENKLTINYYSNYADSSFENPRNAIGAEKNVIVRIGTAKYSKEYAGGFANYIDPSANAYLARTGFTGTGNWNTKEDGSGISIHQDQAFSSGQEMAQAVGKDLSAGNASIDLYPEWTPLPSPPTTDTTNRNVVKLETLLQRLFEAWVGLLRQLFKQ